MYIGPLKANGKPKHKHEIRQQVHSQLKVLWSQPPLHECHSYYEVGKDNKSVDLNRRIGAFRFVPLVSPAVKLVCHLEMLLLRPESPGAIVTQAGDIDNRTLLSKKIRFLDESSRFS